MVADESGFLDLMWPRVFLSFTSYFEFSIAVLPHNAGAVYYIILLLRRETRIPGLPPSLFR